MATKPRNERYADTVARARRERDEANADLEAARADLVEAVAAVIFTAGEDFGLLDRQPSELRFAAHERAADMRSTLRSGKR